MKLIRSIQSLALLLLLGAIGLTSAPSANADYPNSLTTIVAKPKLTKRVGRVEYSVTAVVYAHGATVDKVEFAKGGRWGGVRGTYIRTRRDGGLVYRATIFGQPGAGHWSARSFANGRSGADDYSESMPYP